MTPAEHIQAIEDAAGRYAKACHENPELDARMLEICGASWALLQAAIIAGVGAPPEGWQIVPVVPTEDMRIAMATHGVKHLEWAGDVYAAALAAAPKP